MKILSLLSGKIKTRCNKVVTWIKEDWERGQLTWKHYLLILTAAILFAIGFTLLSNGDQGFLTIFFISVSFVLFIIYLDLVMNMESLLVLEHKHKPQGIWFLFLLVIKEIFISFFMVWIAYILVISSLSNFHFDDEFSKKVYIFAFMATFILGSIFYWFFSESSFRQSIYRFFTKPHHIEKHSVGLPELRRYQAQLGNAVDLFVILATVALLGISIVAAVDFGDTQENDNIYTTFEFSAAMFILPVYIQAAYYKLRQILYALNSN